MSPVGCGPSLGPKARESTATVMEDTLEWRLVLASLFHSSIVPMELFEVICARTTIGFRSETVGALADGSLVIVREVVESDISYEPPVILRTHHAHTSSASKHH